MPPFAKTVYLIMSPLAFVGLDHSTSNSRWSMLNTSGGDMPSGAFFGVVARTASDSVGSSTSLVYTRSVNWTVVSG